MPLTHLTLSILFEGQSCKQSVKSAVSLPIIVLLLFNPHRGPFLGLEHALNVDAGGREKDGGSALDHNPVFDGDRLIGPAFTVGG